MISVEAALLCAAIAFALGLMAGWAIARSGDDDMDEPRTVDFSNPELRAWAASRLSTTEAAPVSALSQARPTPGPDPAASRAPSDRGFD